MFRDLFYDELEVKMPDNATFTKEDVFDLFLYIALTDDFVANSSKTWREDVEDEDTALDGDTFLGYIRAFDELDGGEVSAMFDVVSDLLWQVADRRGYLDGFVNVAIDSHPWRFYGAKDTS